MLNIYDKMLNENIIENRNSLSKGMYKKITHTWEAIRKNVPNIIRRAEYDLNTLSYLYIC